MLGSFVGFPIISPTYHPRGEFNQLLLGFQLHCCEQDNTKSVVAVNIQLSRVLEANFLRRDAQFTIMMFIDIEMIMTEITNVFLLFLVSSNHRVDILNNELVGVTHEPLEVNLRQS